MKHFVLPARQHGKSLAAKAARALESVVTGPLTPGDYLRLRREAAGRSADQLARDLVTVIAHNRPLPKRAPSIAELGARYMRMLDTVRLLEAPRSLCLDTELLDAIASIIPFDPAVYHQLATEPADRHPRICRSCACSDHDQCATHHECCRWITPQLCSHCVEGGLRMAAKVAA